MQFGHAGALANSDLETAAAKNAALRKAGVLVPATFEELPRLLADTYRELLTAGVCQPMREPEIPKVPM